MPPERRNCEDGFFYNMSTSILLRLVHIPAERSPIQYTSPQPWPHRSLELLRDSLEF